MNHGADTSETSVDSNFATSPMPLGIGQQCSVVGGEVQDGPTPH